MFNPGMLDPAVMAFFKQAGEAFKHTASAESEGRMDKALERFCGPSLPVEPSDPNFLLRCQLYAAKAFAMAHIDGATTWGRIGQLLQDSSAWPPAPTLQTEGALFHSFLLGFLIGSDLPRDKHTTILAMIPAAAQMTNDPAGAAQGAGFNPETLKQMASNPMFQQMASNPMFQQMAAQFMQSGMNPNMLQQMASNPMFQQMAAQFMQSGANPDMLQQMANNPMVRKMMDAFSKDKSNP